MDAAWADQTRATGTEASELRGRESSSVLTSTCLTHRRLRHCSCSVQCMWVCVLSSPPMIWKPKGGVEWLITGREGSDLRSGVRGASFSLNEGSKTIPLVSLVQFSVCVCSLFLASTSARCRLLVKPATQRSKTRCQTSGLQSKWGWRKALQSNQSVSQVNGRAALYADSRGSWYYIILYIDTDLMLHAAAQTGIVRQLHGYRGFH